MNTENIPIEQIYDLPLEKDSKYGKDISADLAVLLTECTKYMPKPDLERITRAYYLCIDGHRNIKRKSGEPYYIHPLKVALSLLRTFSITDNESVIAALLHDTVEDVEGITYGTIRSKFGGDVAQIVDGVTKIKGATTRNMDKAATYGKLFLTLVNDIRTIYIKLADRLDNMKTLFHLSPDRQKAIAYETLNFYTPFCQRLGLTKIRRDFEDLSLYFIDPEAFDIIRTSLENKGRIFVEYMKNFIMQIGTELFSKQIPHIITIEHKHVYEIYKMIEMGKTLKEIDNFYSMVICSAKDLNTAAILMQKSVIEMGKFIKLFGGSEQTVYGLAGLGDLYVSIAGGRNRKMGQHLGEGYSYSEAKKKFMPNDTVEGAELAFEIGPKILKDLSKKDFPIMYSLVESICEDKKFVINFL